MKCIAVDMGAGSIRIMLGSVDSGSISYEEVHRFTNEIKEYRGHDRWDAEHIVAEIRRGIARAVELATDAPRSIGVDSWGVDFVLLDEDGKMVDTPVAYRDSRTEGMQERWRLRMSDMETFERTGINFYLFNTLFQVLSLQGSVELERTSKILFIPSYINYILTGKAYNELSKSSTSQMLGVKGKLWDVAILQNLQIDPELLGKVVDPGICLGPVVIPEAKDTRMEGIAVCGHDTACVVAAIPVEYPNYAYISAGTWCIVGIESGEALVSEEALNLGFTNERGYGNSYRILKNIIGLWLMQGLKKHLPENTTYSEMEDLVIRVEGQVMQVINPDDPVFYNPSDMREAFDTFLEKSGQDRPENLSEYLLCAYDSLCFSFRYHLEKLEALSGRPIEVIHLVGGGSQSDYLNQRIATICKRKVISGPVEGAVLGNILVQALALGEIDSLDQGRKLIKQSLALKTYEPLQEPATAAQRYERFLSQKLQ